MSDTPSLDKEVHAVASDATSEPEKDQKDQDDLQKTMDELMAKLKEANLGETSGDEASSPAVEAMETTSPSRMDAFKNRSKTLDTCIHERFERYAEMMVQRREDQLENIRQSNKEYVDLLKEASKSEAVSKPSGVAPNGRNVVSYPASNPKEDEKEPSEVGLDPKPLADESMAAEEVKQAAAALAAADSDEKVLAAAIRIRKALSVINGPPIDTAIQSGCVPRLVQLLLEEQEPRLQLEAAWALTNIASGNSEQTKHVVENGAVECFINILQFKDLAVVEQAIWGLGNISGDSIYHRDYVLEHGIVERIKGVLPRILERRRMPMIRNTCWSISNLCRGKPQPDPKKVRPLIGLITQLIAVEDDEAQTDCCWALSYMSDSEPGLIDSIIEQGLVPLLVQLAERPGHALVPALRTLGNIASGNDAQTQVICDMGAIFVLKKRVNHEKKSVRKEACWTLSNITAGTKEQIKAVLDADALTPVIRCIREDVEEVAKEAVWVVANIGEGGTRELVERSIDQGALTALCKVFERDFNPRVQHVAASGIESFLGHAERLVSKELTEQPEGIALREKSQSGALPQEVGFIIENVLLQAEVYAEQNSSSDSDSGAAFSMP